MSFQPLDRNLTSAYVLVVDDDPDVRTLLGDILEDAGYTVGEARDGQVALDLLQQTTERWVVLTDHVMPRLDGPGLMAAVLADPQLRTRHAVIYMTAAHGDLDPGLQLTLEALHASVLRKPFSTAECVARVASVAERLAHATV
jgi:CheY-like chemotaxis protein